MIKILPELTKEQVAQAKAIKKPKGRYYTEESFRKAVEGEIKRVQMKLADRLLGYYTVASVNAIIDVMGPTYEQLYEILQRTETTYQCMNDPLCEIDFKGLQQGILEETGILVTIDE